MKAQQQELTLPCWALAYRGLSPRGGTISLPWLLPSYTLIFASAVLSVSGLHGILAWEANIAWWASTGSWGSVNREDVTGHPKWVEWCSIFPND